MSVIFRAALTTKGLRWCSSNTSLCKINLNFSPCGSANHNFKICVALSSPLRQEYSTKSSLQNEASGSKQNEKELIYTGMLARNIRNIKLFSLATSSIGLSIQPYVYSQIASTPGAHKLTLPAFGIIAFFSLLTPPMLHFIAKRYVLKVEYVPKDDKYIATVYSLFARKKQIEFTPDDVTIPTVLGMFTTCCVKGKPLFLDAKAFKDQKHYVRIMGYDKPIDLKLGLDADIRQSNSKKNTE